jgi:molybdopterin-guanine dinucleotide biosynthesis protein A
LNSIETRLPAIVLAGAPAEPEMAEMYGIRNRAELPIAGKTMIRHILDALSASSHVGDIHVVGDIECDGVKHIDSRETLIDNLILGAEACPDADRVLVCTSDIPAVTAEVIDDFIGRCTEPDIDFFYPVVTREDSERRFPGVKRTYARMAEGTFTGGNVMLFRRQFLLENGDTIREAIRQRKSVTKLAGLLGYGTLVRVIVAQTVWSGAIRLRDLERVAGRILNARIKAVPTPYAEIAADVDRMDHIADMERCM